MFEIGKDKLKLGQVSVNRDAFELDLKINDGYQTYSAELLRLALLVLTGLSAVWVKMYLPPATPPSSCVFGILFGLSFGSAILSAGAALMHRYTSGDSLAYQLRALRYRARNRLVCDAPVSDAAPDEHKTQTPEILVRELTRLFFDALTFRDPPPPIAPDIVLAEREEGTRDMLFKGSSSLLVWSATLLFIGLVFFCTSMAWVMF